MKRKINLFVVLVSTIGLCYGATYQDTIGCKLQSDRSDQECYNFRDLNNNRPIGEEVLRTVLYVGNKSLPVITVENEGMHEIVFGRYFNQFALYDSYYNYVSQIVPKAVNGSNFAFSANLTQVLVVLEQGGRLTVNVTDKNGFSVTWKSFSYYDQYSSKLCLGVRQLVNSTAYYYDCPINSSVPTTTSKPNITTTTVKPTVTTKVPITNSTTQRTTTTIKPTLTTKVPITNSTTQRTTTTIKPTLTTAKGTTVTITPTTPTTPAPTPYNETVTIAMTQHVKIFAPPNVYVNIEMAMVVERPDHERSYHERPDNV